MISMTVLTATYNLMSVIPLVTCVYTQNVVNSAMNVPHHVCQWTENKAKSGWCPDRLSFAQIFPISLTLLLSKLSF